MAKRSAFLCDAAASKPSQEFLPPVEDRASLHFRFVRAQQMEPNIGNRAEHGDKWVLTAFMAHGILFVSGKP